MWVRIQPMENFRDFEAGPDPFGRHWHAQFKFLQTAISIRNSDSVDVCFVLESAGERLERTVVIRDADLRDYAARSGRPVSDAWCSRLAMCKLKNVIETAEGLDKDYLPVTPREMEELDAEMKKWETAWVKAHAA